MEKPVFCAKCGHSLVEGAVFCPFCGARVTVFSDPVIQGAVFENYDEAIEARARWEGCPPSDNCQTKCSSGASTSTISCFNCGNIIPADSKFCPICQVELFVECPKCGYRYSAQYKNCNQCGTNREEYLRPKTAPIKEKVVSKSGVPLFTQQRSLVYLQQMADFFVNKGFIDWSIEKRMESLERYVSDHLIVSPDVDVIISAIIKDRSFWEGQLCLDYFNLSYEVDKICKWEMVVGNVSNILKG